MSRHTDGRKPSLLEKPPIGSPPASHTQRISPRNERKASIDRKSPHDRGRQRTAGAESGTQRRSSSEGATSNVVRKISQPNAGVRFIAEAEVTREAEPIATPVSLEPRVYYSWLEMLAEEAAQIIHHAPHRLPAPPPPPSGKSKPSGPIRIDYSEVLAKQARKSAKIAAAAAAAAAAEAAAQEQPKKGEFQEDITQYTVEETVMDTRDYHRDDGSAIASRYDPRRKKAPDIHKPASPPATVPPPTVVRTSRESSMISPRSISPMHAKEPLVPESVSPPAAPAVRAPQDPLAKMRAELLLMENALRDIESFRFVEHQRLKDQMQAELLELKAYEKRIQAQAELLKESKPGEAAFRTRAREALSDSTVCRATIALERFKAAREHNRKQLDELAAVFIAEKDRKGHLGEEISAFRYALSKSRDERNHIADEIALLMDQTAPAPASLRASSASRASGRE